MANCAVVLLATCLAAAAKLRATPKYDRIQVGMRLSELRGLLGPPVPIAFFDVEGAPGAEWETDEGTIILEIEDETDQVTRKFISRRDPLERLAWLVGWR